MIEYTLIRSKRRTLSLSLGRGGKLIARAPRYMIVSMIESFIDSKKCWIEKHQKSMRARKGNQKEYTDLETKIMKIQLKEYILLRLPFFYEGRGLPKYTHIKITKSEKRWGSCSAKNGLCFSYRLAECIEERPEFIDAIIVHELAHLREKNHGKKFWKLVYEIMPIYEDIMKDYKLSNL